MPLPSPNAFCPPRAAGIAWTDMFGLGLLGLLAAGLAPGGLQCAAVLAVVLLTAARQGVADPLPAHGTAPPRPGPGGGSPWGQDLSGADRRTVLARAADLMTLGCYAEALTLVDHDLSRRPRKPEALVLKAQILRLAHDDTYAARRYCQAAMGLTAPGEPCFQAALEVFLSLAAAPRPQ
jgi:hypothetical protein